MWQTRLCGKKWPFRGRREQIWNGWIKQNKLEKRETKGKLSHLRRKSGVKQKKKRLQVLFLLSTSTKPCFELLHSTLTFWQEKSLQKCSILSNTCTCSIFGARKANIQPNNLHSLWMLKYVHQLCDGWKSYFSNRCDFIFILILILCSLWSNAGEIIGSKYKQKICLSLSVVNSAVGKKCLILIFQNNIWKFRISFGCRSSSQY